MHSVKTDESIKASSELLWRLSLPFSVVPPRESPDVKIAPVLELRREDFRLSSCYPDQKYKRPLGDVDLI
jgi:hypothetical protein